MLLVCQSWKVFYPYLQPLQDVLSAPLIPGYTRQVFVLTDGEVSNTKETIECVQRYQSQARLFAIGLGEGASHELVEGIGMSVSSLT